MKGTAILIALAFAAAAPACADDAPLEALCAAHGGKLQRAGVSGVQRLDCAGPAVTWFLVRKDGERLTAHYAANRQIPWKAAVDAALADLEVICGDTAPQLQFDHRKLLADCGSARK